MTHINGEILDLYKFNDNIYKTTGNHYLVMGEETYKIEAILLVDNSKNTLDETLKEELEDLGIDITEE